MNVTIETGRWAARYVGEDPVCINMTESSTVMDAIEAIGLPPDEAGITTIGGKAVPKGLRLSDGDYLKIYPVIIGG